MTVDVTDEELLTILVQRNLMNKFLSDYITDDELVREVDTRDIGSRISNLDDFTDYELERECEERAIWPEEMDIDDISDRDLIDAVDERGLYSSFDDIDLDAFRRGDYSELLEQLERKHPIEFAGLTKMRLVK